jgi:hypothetical protein
VSAARCLPPAQVRRLVDAVRDGVRREDIVRSHGIGTTRLARIIAEHAPELAARPPAQRGGGLTKVRRGHLERLARGPAPLVSDPTREAVLMPRPLISRTTLAWLQARGLVEVTGDRPRVVTITPAGRAALAAARAQIARAL